MMWRDARRKEELIKEPADANDVFKKYGIDEEELISAMAKLLTEYDDKPVVDVLMWIAEDAGKKSKARIFAYGILMTAALMKKKA